MRALVLLALLGAPACAPSDDADDAPAPLRAVAFNVRYDWAVSRSDPDDWAHTHTPRRDRALDVLDRLQPDLLGAQEVLYPQRLDLLGHLPDHDVHAVGRDDGDSLGEACPVAWRRDRFTALDQGTFWLGPTPDVPGSTHPDVTTPRIASWVVLEDLQGSPELLVVSTHLDHTSGTARTDGADQLVRTLSPMAEGRAVVLLGDLNTVEDTEPVQRLLDGLDLTDPYRTLHPPDPDEATFHGFTGRTRGQRIDFVLASPGLVAVDAGIDRVDTDGLYPSDHFPVWADLQPAAEGGP